MKAYPELERMRAVKNESQALGEFLEWILNRYNVTPRGTSPNPYQIERVLAMYFNIDLKKAEQEQTELLNECRQEANAKRESR